MLVHVDAIGLERVAVTTRHLNQIELSRRWGFSPRTLEGWRWFGKGVDRRGMLTLLSGEIGVQV